MGFSGLGLNGEIRLVYYYTIIYTLSFGPV